MRLPCSPRQRALTKIAVRDIIRFVQGEWLNGRAAVSKTAGCVFESRLPCHRQVLTDLERKVKNEE